MYWRSVRAWAPHRGARIGGIPEWLGFALVLAFAAGLIAVALLIR
jgi:hypothetical protein